MDIRASRVTRVDLSEDRIISDGETITVFGVVVANSLCVPIEVDIEDGTQEKRITVTVPCADSKVIDFSWVADKGVRISGLASDGDMVFVTVFHSQTT